MLYAFKNDLLDPHLPELQLKFLGIAHTLRGPTLSADPAERAAPVPGGGGAGAGFAPPPPQIRTAPVPSFLHTADSDHCGNPNDEQIIRMNVKRTRNWLNDILRYPDCFAFLLRGFIKRKRVPVYPV